MWAGFGVENAVEKRMARGRTRRRVEEETGMMGCDGVDVRGDVNRVEEVGVGVNSQELLFMGVVFPRRSWMDGVGAVVKRVGDCFYNKRLA